MSPTPVISLRSVRKTYGDFELGPITLNVEPGHVVAIVGPYGGGKSTLMEMLMNLIRPTSGEITLFGGVYPDDEVAIKRRIGYAPEHPSGYEDLSASALGRFVAHFYPGWDQMLYEDLLSGMVTDPDKAVGDLPRGAQRCLNVALALATGSELLLLDEPTADLDPLARRRVLGGISRFTDDERHGDRTVVFATHVVEEVRSIADYVAILVDGKLLGVFERDALLENWRYFWLDREPEGDVPRTIALEGGNPARIVSDSPRETEEALSAQNTRILGSGTLELEEILSHLMRRREERRTRSPYTGE